MKFPRLSLRSAVIIPFMIVIISLVTAITALQKKADEEMLEELGQTQLATIADNINSNLQSFLRAPFTTTLALKNAITYKELYRPENLQQLSPLLLNIYQGIADHIPQLDAIGFGGELGQSVGFRKEANNQFSLVLKDASTQDDLIIYHSDSISDNIRFRLKEYDPRQRPWYIPIAKSHQSAWSEPYINNDERQEITISALSPVIKDNQFIGILSADVKLSSFNQFLAKVKQRYNTSIFIFDQDKRLLAHSDDINSVIKVHPEQQLGQHPLPVKIQRYKITESPDYIIQQTALRLLEQPQEQQDQSQNQFSFTLDNKRYFTSVNQFKDDHGLNLSIAITLPESELLGRLPWKQKQVLFLGILVSFLAAGVGLVIFNKIIQPINETADAARSLAKGDWEAHVSNHGYLKETHSLVSSFREMSYSLKKSFDALRKQLTYDSLTQVYSRQGLIAQTQDIDKSQGTLFIIGLERFRDINDCFGHVRGDQALIIISERLKSLTSDDYYLARVSGDEFAIFATEMHLRREVDEFILKLKQHFIAPIRLGAERVLIKPVISHTNSIASGSDMETWLRNASIAQSFAKKEIIRVAHYQSNMTVLSRERTDSIAKITQAIESKEFVPYYQPLIDLQTNQVIGAEALARWLSPVDGVISPVFFIPIAEDYDLIQEIGYQILLQACLDTQQALESGLWPEHFQVHVNVSVKQLKMPTFIEELNDIVSISKLNIRHLKLEITESNFVSDNNQIEQNIQAIRDLGIEIAIDDFGTGYSSLSYLHQIDFECLKIDRSFIKDLTPANAENSVTATILKMAQQRKVSVVAEGIETEEQAQILRDFGCDIGQGFLFGRPCPIEEWNA